MVTSSCSMPRNRVVMAGVRSSHILVSQTSARSRDNSLRCALRKGARLGEPDSSSPSKRIVTFSGIEPVVSIHALLASTKVISWPLSSAAPRAYTRFYIAVFRFSHRFKWRRVPFFDRIDRLDVIVTVKQHMRCIFRTVFGPIVGDNHGLTGRCTHSGFQNRGHSARW